jgi:hypothetical protein
VPVVGDRFLAALGAVLVASAILLVGARARNRRRRTYRRWRLLPYRTDVATGAELVGVLELLHKRLLRRWWRRLLHGQPSGSLEVHVLPSAGGDLDAVLAVSIPPGVEHLVLAALRTAYPNLRLEPFPFSMAAPPSVLRLKKHASFIQRIAVADERAAPGLCDRLLVGMAATKQPCAVQLALTPAPALFDIYARFLFRARERHLSRDEQQGVRVARSEVERAELQGGLSVQHRALFFCDLRVIASNRGSCEAIAAELRAAGAENRLVERSTTIRQVLGHPYDRRVSRGEGNPLPSFSRGVFASTELAALWHLPSVEFTAVPFARAPVPLAPAPPTVLRRRPGEGLLRDAIGPVAIHPDLRRQNTAVPGAVEQGKTSYLVATIREDLARPECAVILFDPKGDAADAALSLVGEDRVCTILDFAAPTCGFNPLAVDASPDVIADYVVAAMRNLFDVGDIRASSDRYLRNAIIAVLAFSKTATLWDAVRLLSVTDEGYAYRQRVGEHVRGLPEFKEIGEFFTQELRAQLRDAKTMTTSKLDAPVNKAARLLNSASIKRVLQNTSLTVDFDRVIAERQVLVVKGALGTMGAGNTSVLMQLLMGMLDAALARQQDQLAAAERVAVALKIDEAPLVVNRGFAQTLALKRSAGLECVACWQTDAQWTDRDVRDQLDALFAHRVYFATASVADARAAADLLMAEYADSVRPGAERASVLGSPDVRLHLPKHWAIASWVTPDGRAQPFVAQTIPLRTDPDRIARHHAAQAARGGRVLERFHQPHWDRELDVTEDVLPPAATAPAAPEPEPQQARAAPGQPVAQAAPVATDGQPGEGGANGEGEPDPWVDVKTALTVDLVRRRAQSAARPPDDHEPADSEPASVALEPAPVDVPARSRVAPAPRAPAPPAPARATTATDLVTFTELAAIDEARSVTWPRRSDHKAATPDALDLTLIAWLAEMRFALATQIHRTFFSDKSYSTTQRRLKRMHQAGWVERFQYFRSDGSSSPLVYLATDEGIKAVAGQVGPRGPYLSPKRSYSAPATTDPIMRHARHDVHVVAWMLALQALLGDHVRQVRGPRSGYLAPPWRTVQGERHDYGPDDLRLPGGRTPHGFLRSDQGRRARVPVTRFEALEPDATVELRIQSGRQLFHTDLFVEMDRTFKPSKNISKFERYDHLITGWARHKDRYAKYLNTLPLVMFVCRDEDSASEFCRAADPVVTACHSYAGEYPGEWDYAGRERMFFVAERAIHEARLDAYAMPRLPPEVRVAQADGDRRAAGCQPRAVSVLGN